MTPSQAQNLPLTTTIIWTRDIPPEIGTVVTKTPTGLVISWLSGFISWRNFHDFNQIQRSASLRRAPRT